MPDALNACDEGLTPACFAAHPKFARQMFTYRLLILLFGPVGSKRLQTMIGVPLPDPPTEAAGAALSVVAPFFGTSCLGPMFTSPWEPGPVHLIPSQEGDLIMATLRKATINIATAATHEIIAAVAGLKITIASIAFTVAGDVNVTLLSAADPLSGAMDFGGTDEPRGIAHSYGVVPLQCAEAEAFNMTLSAAVQVSGMVTYYLD